MLPMGLACEDGKLRLPELPKVELPEFAVRHLRVGTPASYESSAEPLCHYLSGGPYLYQPGPGTPEALARTWCGCS